MSMKIEKRFSFNFKPTNIFGAFMLLTALVAQPFYGVVAALQATSYTEKPFTNSELAEWIPDRTAPSGGVSSVSYGERANVAAISIDTAKQSPIEFHFTEGIQRPIPASDSIKADVYVESDWADKKVRAGLWGVGVDAASAIRAYPIIEYTTDGTTGWRAYDSNTGLWRILSAANPGWNTLEIEHNEKNNVFDYKINGTVVYSYDDGGSVGINTVILNSKNYGPLTQSYTAHWSNFSYGKHVFVTEQPTGLRVADAGGNPLVCGTATNDSSITASWDSVADAARYNYRSWAPNSAAGYSTQENAYTTSTGNTSMPGSFPLGEGPYLFQVQTVYSDGQISEWSEPCSITYDKTLPTLPTLLAPANNTFKNVNDFYFDWTDSTDASALTYEFQSSQNPATTSGVLSSGVWNNVRDGNAEQKNLTTSTIHSVGADNTWYWQVRAVDAAGNTSAWTPVWKTTIDIVAPVANITSPSADGTVQGVVNVAGTVTDANPMNTYFSITGPNGYSLTSFYGDGRTTHNLSWDTTALQNGVYKIKFETRDRASNKTSVSTTAINVNVANPVPSVAATDFGVAGWTLANEGFAGVSVGFSADDFDTISGMSVDLYDASGKFVTNTATPNFLTEINANNWTTLSSPFVTSGTFKDTFCGGGECWTRGAVTWTTASKPVKAVISVTGTNAAGKSVTETAEATSFSESVASFSSVLPLVTVTPPASQNGRGSANTPAPVLPTVASPVAARAIARNPSVVTTSDEATDNEVLGSSTVNPEVLAASSSSAVDTTLEEDSLASDDQAGGANLSALWWLTVPVALGAGGWILLAARRSND